MKLKMAVIAALALCSLYGCSSTRETSSIYTPAPITPRPTFNTNYYRTKEEITAKQPSDFVIADLKTPTPGGYPAVKNEYNRKIEYAPEPTAIASVRSSASIYDFSGIQRNPIVSYGIEPAPVSAPVSTPAPTPQPTEKPVARNADSIPDGFSSTNYPFTVRSSDGRTYLGKITSDVSDEECIWNSNSQYGSADSDTSIFNTNGIYGSAGSAYSAFNDDASNPPWIFDSTGAKIGVLSTNLSIKDGINPETLKSYADSTEGL